VPLALHHCGAGLAREKELRLQRRLRMCLSKNHGGLIVNASLSFFLLANTLSILMIRAGAKPFNRFFLIKA